MMESMPAYRAALARAKEGLAAKVDLASNQSLVANAEQRGIFNMRGVETPKSVFIELAEQLKRSFADMPMQSFTANLGKFSERMSQRRKLAELPDGDKNKLSAYERIADEAISNAMGMRGQEGWWFDDHDYALRDTPKARKQFKKAFGWDPSNALSSQDKYGTIMSLDATGHDKQFAIKDRFMRLMAEEAQKLDVPIRDVYQGLAGVKGLKFDPSQASELKQRMQAIATKLGGDQYDNYKIIFEAGGTQLEDWNKDYMERLERYKPYFEYWANNRDTAIKGNHTEMAGQFQVAEVAPGKKMFVGSGATSAAKYGLGDLAKGGPTDRKKQHGHVFGKVLQYDFAHPDKPQFGQFLYEYEDEPYRVVHSDTNDYRIWNAATTTRNKNWDAGYEADVDLTLYKDKLGYARHGFSSRTDGGLAGDFAAYKNLNKDVFRGKSLKEQEALASKLMMHKKFYKQLRYAQPHFLFSQAFAAGVDALEAQRNGTMRAKFAGVGKYNNISKLIKDVNDGKFDIPELGLYLEPVQGYSPSKVPEDIMREASED